jgi:photosystem I P700 chlorophyll a apoprotein A2
MGSLDDIGSKPIPDKSSFGFGFACDGPARGGTCDISAWDSFYLALFWLLNSEAWLLFYSHWKLLTANPSSMLKFQESASYLDGWFRDYLWYYSSNLIRGYDAVLAVWDWLFLAAHLIWAIGFMFLISWRGYW